MSRKQKNIASVKVRTGIDGFDEITGGLPRGRIAVVFGSAGSGKTIFALQTLVSGAKHGEPGIFVAFEESAEEIGANAARFSWNLSTLEGGGLGFFDAQWSDATVEGGAFDLVGFLAMLGAKAKALRAKRVAFDGIDILLAHLQDPALARREVIRLREWLRRSGMTGIITAKTDAPGIGLTPDYDFLQYMSDCVVSLNHRVISGTAFRTLRVVKFRGDGPSANEFPFTITSSGIEVATGTSSDLEYAVSNERVSSGVARLDSMLRGG